MKDVIRTIVTQVAEGVIKRFSGTGRPGERFADREYFQHYGFTSRPLDGAEGIVLRRGNNIFLVATDDRRHRIAIEDGEVCLYTDEGDFILLGRNRQMHISTGGKLTVDAASEVEINTIDAVVNATGKCQVNSPEINLSGDRGGLRRFVDERVLALFNEHTHPGCTSGNTGVPNTGLNTGDTCTDIVRGA